MSQTVFIILIKEPPCHPTDIGHTAKEAAAKAYCLAANQAMDAAWPFIAHAQGYSAMSYWALAHKPIFQYRSSKPLSDDS